MVGGTGPTGPQIVAGLQARGHDVAVLHTGLHEVDLGADVEHIHTDPHFAEPLAAALHGRSFDIALGMYGRLSVVAEALRGHTGCFVGVTAMFYDGWVDDVLHDASAGAAVSTADYRDHRVPTSEDFPFAAAPGDRFSRKAIEAEQLVLRIGEEGGYHATMLRFPRIYGPRQPAPTEWSIIRRLLDGRRQVLVPDGGLLLESRAFAGNAANFVLAAADAQLDGEIFNVADREVLSLRQWIRTIADALDCEVEMVSVPVEAASITFSYSKGPFTMGHRVLSIDKACRRLDVERHLRSAPDALRATVEWYVDDPSRQPVELANDRFDYDAEDALIRAVLETRDSLAVHRDEFRYRHAYRHPTSQG